MKPYADFHELCVFCIGALAVIGGSTDSAQWLSRAAVGIFKIIFPL